MTDNHQCFPPQERYPKTTLVKAALPFLTGCASAMVGTFCVQPIDMIKVRLQLLETKMGPISVARDIIKKGSVLDLYQGISAGLLRQVVYGTTRLGLFFNFERLLHQRAQQNGTTLSFGERAVAGLSAGGLAASIGTPVETALIRMQADGLKPHSQQAHYRSVFDTISRIVRQEGVLALWNGTFPNTARAMTTNFGQLAFFSETRARLKLYEFPESCHTLIAASVAGFVGSFLSMPFDFVKTRLQNQSLVGPSSVRYKGTIDCFLRTAREEGLYRFYRGYSTWFLRLAPHTLATPNPGTAFIFSSSKCSHI
ncbi:mitochondrial 2-oxoglutarate/malate carrier protein [Penicillium riverlandense]|uniref:mitochondrial 2-oxoglutarate/malate carrier protein n=1 Tax=Penicillium riverlandense TaxID=1903569 RepID=UPI0025493386|nr:mitochondrial 2-oxoglutarate/malate carrier protein [Penicillium riverlandense]KAJ5825435.1 mitochondrial 2-oxoglutarate/malate carrier protein [Penicillium riverlandense]